MLNMNTGFNFEKNSEKEEKENGITLSLVLEDILLKHYFILTLNKAFKGTLPDFWEMDTYTTYALVNWTNEMIETRKDMMDNPDKYEKHSNPQGVEDDPETLDFFKKVTGREEDD